VAITTDDAQNAAPAGNRPSLDEMTRLFHRMVLVRRMEEALGRLHREGRTRGPIHRCDGQEAVGIGATAVLRSDDTVTSTHRGHAHYIGKGLDARRVIAEIFGRATGYGGGRAGHMLIADAGHGMLGGNAIIGAGLALAVGQALAHEALAHEVSAQARGEGRVAMCFFGDGAAQNGLAHEAMNMAGLWRLPVVFVCEHNQYGLTVHARHQSAIPDLSERARGYAMPGVMVDGNDVVAVYRAADAAVRRARAGEGPTFIEAKTYRLEGFSTSDMGGYQPAEEIAAWRQRDPIALLRARLVPDLGESEVARLEQDADAALEAALAEALADPLPDPATPWPEYVAVAHAGAA
jgi:acetoin:2,6-dichlorophenolindophenol oxidoreductase subunit alpha